jgi:hypothetical protein
MTPTQTKLAGIAGLALIALLAIPSSTAAVAVPVQTHVTADVDCRDIDTFQVDQDLFQVNSAIIDQLCSKINSPPAGLCTYSDQPHYTRTTCTVAADPNGGYCVGYDNYHDKDDSSNDWTTCAYHV